MAGLPDTTGKLIGKAKEIYNDILARRTAQGAKVRGLYIPLMNHPELAQHIERLGYYLKFEGKLPRDAYQFIVLSIARRIGVAFEWVDHVAHARAAGLSDALIEAILKADRVSIPHPYSVILDTIDVVLELKSIPENIQNEMINMYEVQGLLEVVTLCGFYQMVGEITEAFDVPLPENAEKPF
ncbi:MAG: carboxymuconolactone decarboxylase family protein [Desulfomonile tiedjei]|nr:carboxymuconolactone decarboxylase family protein [Desulfomonile tiedjei]